MSKKTIIFLSGLGVFPLLSKSKFVWNEPFWQDYKCIFYTSKIPISDPMVDKELNHLSKMINKCPEPPIVAGQSLGGWWAANLACHPEVNMKKVILWTPLGKPEIFPIFNTSNAHNPCYKEPCIVGTHNVLTFYADDDWIVPMELHATDLIDHFNSLTYQLHGGHISQNNHQAALKYMKEWIEIVI